MKKTIFAPLLVLMPSIAFAAPQTFSQLVDLFISYVNPIITILTSLVLLIFFWGVTRYIYSAGSEGYKQGRDTMVWGIVALFVLVCLWGLVTIARLTLFGEGGTAP